MSSVPVHQGAQLVCRHDNGDLEFKSSCVCVCVYISVCAHSNSGKTSEDGMKIKCMRFQLKLFFWVGGITHKLNIWDVL